MSKKLYSTEKWKEYIKARQEAERRNAARHKKGPKFTGTRAQKQQAQRKRQYQIVQAPSVFSIVNNTNDAMQFFTTLELYSSKYNINLDLSQVQTLTTDAIAALIATAQRLDAVVRGNLPNNPDAQKMLLESGFFKYVSSTQPLPSTPRGTIEQKANTIVSPSTAKTLVHFGTKAIFGTSQRNRPSYSTLIECMANTKGHAAGRNNPNSRSPKPSETWWATVYADVGRKKICFTFVDTGVGIFRSIRIRVVRKIYDFFGGKDDTDILRDMLDGKVPSSTTLSFRGKGLPYMKRLARANRISSLVIVANDVYANVSLNKFMRLRNSFHGTLVYWEV
jgi:hypothetical protein